MSIPWNSPIGKKIAKLGKASPKPKRSKFGNKSAVVNGIKFHSRKEATRYKILIALEGAGAIQDLKLQPRFRLKVNGEIICTYVADFQYVQCGKTIVEDVKGFRTREYILKKKLVKALLGISIKET